VVVHVLKRRAPRVGRLTPTEKTSSWAGCRAWARAALVEASTHGIGVPSGGVSTVDCTASVWLRKGAKRTSRNCDCRMFKGYRCVMRDAPGLTSSADLPRLDYAAQDSHIKAIQVTYGSLVHFVWQPCRVTLGRIPITSPPSALPGDLPELLLRRELLGGAPPHNFNIRRLEGVGGSRMVLFPYLGHGTDHH
jgi:hypothetical protein